MLFLTFYKNLFLFIRLKRCNIRFLLLRKYFDITFTPLVFHIRVYNCSLMVVSVFSVNERA